MLRAPAFASELWREISAARSEPECRARLIALLKNERFRDALALASNDLTLALGLDAAGPPPEPSNPELLALYKYAARASTRSTPFGLFASVSLGTCGGRTTQLTLGPESVPVLRLDRGLSRALSRSLGKRPEVRRTCTILPSSGLYRSAGDLRLLRMGVTKASPSLGSGASEASKTKLVAIKERPGVRAALHEAEQGSTFAAIALAVVEAEAVDQDAAEAFVDLLLDREILVPLLEPALTDSDALGALIARLPDCEAKAQLEGLYHQLSAEASVAESKAAACATISAIDPSIETARPLAIDLHRPVETLRLGDGVLAEVRRAAESLLALSSPQAAPELEAFRKALLSRYEGRPVSLVDALDPERGIGFGHPASEPVLRRASLLGPSTESARTFGFSALHERILDRMAETPDAEEIEIDAADLPDPEVTPDAFSVCAVLAAESCAAVDRGEYAVLIKGVRPGSGADLWARFAHLTPELHDATVQLAAQATHVEPHAIHAELVHFPSNVAAGNVVVRPRIFEHELVFLAPTAGFSERQIRVDDLIVHADADRIILRSKRYGREVVLHLTSAHYDGDPANPALYRLLGAIARGPATQASFDLGALAHLPRLPRIRLRTQRNHPARTILSRARFRLDTHTLKAVLAAGPSERMAHIEAWRARLKVPQHVLHVMLDNELAVDLRNPLAVDVLLALTKGKSVMLEELWPAQEQLLVQAADGRYHHEMFLPFTRVREAKTGIPAATASSVKKPSTRDAQRFNLGGRWSYLKLYAGPETQDRLLVTRLAPLLANLGPDLRRWFFIRYQDEIGAHLRLRLNLVSAGSAKSWRNLLREISAWPEVERCVLDTYERELDRYGGPKAMRAAETLFAVDSAATLELLRCVAASGPEVRARTLLQSTEQLVRDLGVNELPWLKRRRDAWVAELGITAPRKRGLSQTLLALDATALPREVSGILEARSAALTQVIARLKRCADAEGEFESIADSLVHMHVNRLARSRPRSYEALAYHYLVRRAERVAHG